MNVLLICMKWITMKVTAMIAMQPSWHIIHSTYTANINDFLVGDSYNKFAGRHSPGEIRVRCARPKISPVK